MEKQVIKEADKVQEEWYREAGKMTMDKLPEFLKHLMEDYVHDYGTICHAHAAGAIATMWAMNREPQGGITGFQAGAIMWEVVRNWSYTDNKTGLKMVNFDNMLFPQYEESFEKKISMEVWENLKKEAALKIQENLKDSLKASPKVVAHWESIVAGEIPFGYKVEVKHQDE